jgi:hypothetical protein
MKKRRREVQGGGFLLSLSRVWKRKEKEEVKQRRHGDTQSCMVIHETQSGG